MRSDFTLEQSFIIEYIYVNSHRKGIKKEMMRFGAFVIFGGSDVDAGRFADEPWQFQSACAVVFLLEDWSR